MVDLRVGSPVYSAPKGCRRVIYGGCEGKGSAGSLVGGLILSAYSVVVYSEDTICHDGGMKS